MPSAVLNLMIGAARKAARQLLRDFGEVEQLQVSRKGPGDFVTAADRRAEEIVRDELARARPDYGFLMEESGRHGDGTEQSVWIVDPLDGTTNFLHGLPHFAISIALQQAGELVAGLVFDPIKDELFLAEKGRGAWLNDRRVRCSARADLPQAVIGCGLPVLDWVGRATFDAQYAAVADHVAGLRRFGVASLDLAYVACGRFDGFWEIGLKPWDIAAGLVLLREAGATIKTLESDDPLEGGTLVVGTIGVQPKLMRLLAGATPALGE
jgi:myo-inositol-1(or 4)-monophosphatase